LKIRDAQGFTLWNSVNASRAKGSATINTYLRLKEVKVMKKLLKYVACLAILVMVVALFTGCKATGGGWFEDCQGDKCTFGFNAQGTGEGLDWEYKGQFQFKDHGTGEKFHISKMYLVEVVGNVANFTGEDKDGDVVNVTVTDMGEPGAGSGDGILIVHSTLGVWAGVIDGGNIQVH
jgi:hypothetical protein